MVGDVRSVVILTAVTVDLSLGVLRLAGEPGLYVRVDSLVYIVHHVVRLVRLLGPLFLGTEVPL